MTFSELVMVSGFTFLSTIGFRHCTEFMEHKQHQAEGARVSTARVGNYFKLAGWKRTHVPQVSLVINYENHILFYCAWFLVGKHH